MRKKIYICLPDTAEKSILEKASVYTKYVLKCGAAPVVPHLLIPYLSDSENTVKTVSELSRSLLWFCDEMWVFEDTADFHGIGEKIGFCKTMTIPIVQISSRKINKVIGGITA